MAAFRLISRENIKEIDGALAIYEHEKTGAKLVHIDNADAQKLFMIGFRTMPEDDSGVAHIMEHSVLNGSRHYPVKAPFVELMKGSLNTFLNAMTNNDWTCYPVMSPNLKDFYNLMDVYLDAVMNPLLYENPEVLMQEGWHYELDAQGRLMINGVVYNEMKGAMSDAQRQLSAAVAKELHTTFYRFNSGGDPAAIPTLTQEKFVAFHKKYYHPSNSITVVSGTLDIEPVLEHIDRNYFSHYTHQQGMHIPQQPRMDAPSEAELEYAVPGGQDTAAMTYLAVAMLTYAGPSNRLDMAMRILGDILFAGEASPVKRAILDAGIGREVDASCEGGKDGEFIIEVSGAEPSDMQRLKTVLDGTLRSLVRDGLDSKLVEGAVNKFDFRKRQSQDAGVFSRVMRALTLLDAWNADGDLMGALGYSDAIDDIRRMAADGYFEGLIEKYLIGNPHTVYVTLKPSEGLAERAEAAERERLAGIMAEMSGEDIEKIRLNAEKLKIRQQTPDAPEALATMPRLTLADVDTKATFCDLTEETAGDASFLYHERFTSGITYADAMFDMSALTREERKYAALIAAALGKLPTKKRGYEELAIETDIETGGISACCLAQRKKDGSAYPYMCVSARALTQKLDRALSLMGETIAQTDYSASARLEQVVKQIFTGVQSELEGNAYELAILRCRSYFREEAQATDDMTGLGWYEFIKNIARTVQHGGDTLYKALEHVAQKLFTRANLTLLVTGSPIEKAAFAKNADILMRALPDGRKAGEKCVFSEEIRNEGMMSASMVQYVCEAYDYTKLGFAYNGSALALNSFLYSGYMWQRVREQGGAYGFNIAISDDGVLDISSYRDPKLAETLAVYRGIGEYLCDVKISDSDVTNSIISAISSLDTPLMPHSAGVLAFANRISGKTIGQKQRERDELIASTAEDMRAFATLFDAVTAKGCICVYGNEEKLRANADLFKSLVAVDG